MEARTLHRLNLQVMIRASPPYPSEDPGAVSAIQSGWNPRVKSTLFLFFVFLNLNKGNDHNPAQSFLLI